jgi:hypothetical protein
MIALQRFLVGIHRSHDHSSEFLVVDKQDGNVISTYHVPRSGRPPRSRIPLERGSNQVAVLWKRLTRFETSSSSIPMLCGATTVIWTRIKVMFGTRVANESNPLLGLRVFTVTHSRAYAL